MSRFHHGPVEIAFLDEGHGDPIVLVHGFASNKDVNWVQPGWVATLVRAGRRVIALDNRGHGHSTKLYSPSDYAIESMMEDTRALLDHLGFERVDLMGYSMGGRITALLAATYPGRVRSAILGGIGIRMVDGLLYSESLAQALEAPSLADVADPLGRSFRAFADQTRSDLRALAACMRGSRQTMSREACRAITAPVLIAVGTKDTIAGSGHDLAALISTARAIDIPGRDHMLAVGDRVYKTAVLSFLEERP